MAPALTSPSSRPSGRRRPRPPQTRQNLFSFGKPMGDGSSEEEAKELDGTTDKANRFFIDFRKIPDAKSLVPVIISPEESKRQNAVESAFQDAESIAKATVPATKVVVTIGVADKGPSAEVTTDVLEVIRAAEHAVVYNSGPGGFSGRSMYNVLDGITSSSNLFVRSQQLTLGESSLVAELDVSYTLIKAGQPHRAHTGWWQQKREVPPKQVNSRYLNEVLHQCHGGQLHR
ncbi:hypothetical protein B296_00023387 [Ensete ventricosum]|uniref:Uncharacterized protein n=1 Tax=Ensete ventricosum TaxID=4639 RepID=A0A427AQH7_ENSVE|nr:hypothetical protein B296_00023387 [Ensete ventricosum]